MPERRPADLRPPYALTPITKHVTVTEAVRRFPGHSQSAADAQVSPSRKLVPKPHVAPPIARRHRCACLACCKSIVI